MKEQLIRELVKTGRDAQMINKEHENRIKELEKVQESLSSVLTCALEFTLCVIIYGTACNTRGLFYNKILFGK